MSEGDRTSAERQHLKQTYQGLYEEISRILWQENPIGISFSENSDEYDPEVGSILPRLKEASSVEELRRIIHEEFVHWFDADIAGPEARYDKIAQDIWGA